MTSTDIFKGYKYNYHFYDVLRSPRIDHLQPVFYPFETSTNSPEMTRINLVTDGDIRS